MNKSLVNRLSILKVLLILSLLQISACSESQQSDVNKMQPAQAKNSTTALSQPIPTANSGTVKSIQNAGGYSYMEIDIGGQIFWMAASLSAVKPGDKVIWNGHAMMKNFSSKTLGRTFAQIMFVDRVIANSSITTSNHSGFVLETMTAAGYSYIRVEESGKKIWLAAPEVKIKTGQKISWKGGTAMRNFASQSLNRSFDEIFFVSLVKINQS